MCRVLSRAVNAMFLDSSIICQVVEEMLWVKNLMNGVLLSHCDCKQYIRCTVSYFAFIFSWLASLRDGSGK